MNLLENLLRDSDDLTARVLLFGLLISFVHGLIISRVYLKTYTGFSFDRTFSFTLIILTVIVTLVMFVISTNIALSLGLLGSLSIIRFRTVIKDSKDMGFLFWAIAMGLTVGAKYFYLSFIVIIFISLMIFLVERLNINKIKNIDYILVINFNFLNKNISTEVEKILKNYKLDYNLKSSFSDSKSKNSELTYNITLKDKININYIQDKVSKIKNVNNVSLLGPETNIYA